MLLLIPLVSVLSVKMFDESQLLYQYKHFSIRHSPHWGHSSSWYSLQPDTVQHQSLRDMIQHHRSDDVTDNSLQLSSVCLIPNPLSGAEILMKIFFCNFTLLDDAVLRSWELELQEDKWMIPREELVLGVELGHGYFGSVHRGVWRQSLEVAVKTLRHKDGRSQEDFNKEKNTFLSETEIMKRLNHPHLVKMLGICVEKSPFYLVQELCQNGDLKHHLKTFEFVKVFQHISYLHNAKKSEKFKSVPSFSRLLSWCIDILKGSFN